MRKKLLFMSQIILGAVLLLYSFLSSQIFYDALVDNNKSRLNVFMNLFHSNEYTMNDEGAKSFSEKISGLRVSYIDKDGNIMGDSLDNYTVSQIDKEEVVLAFNDGEGYSIRHSNSMDENTIYYCRKIEMENQEDIYVRIAMSSSSEWNVFKRNLPTFGVFLALGFIVCIIVTYIETEYIIEPVHKLAKDASCNKVISTKYSELRPIVEMLNKRNKEVEEQFKELEEEKELVERAQRSKNDFIANITHEMNTPLTSIRGYSELLASNTMNETQTKMAVDTILKQSDRLSKLITCIIDYNEIDNDELPSYEVNLSKIAEETLEIVAPDISKRNIILEKNIEKNINVMSRHERLSEVIGNLIRNAIRYNKEGGKLIIKVGKNEEDRPYLIVQDEGIGIAKENIDRIFERFFTVDKSHNGKHGGFGLGLAVVKKICKKSKWIMNVDSELGKGTKFSIIF